MEKINNKPLRIISLLGVGVLVAAVLGFVIYVIYVNVTKKEPFSFLFDVKNNNKVGKYSWNDSGFGVPNYQNNWSRGEFVDPFRYNNQGLYEQNFEEFPIKNCSF